MEAKAWHNVAMLHVRLECDVLCPAYAVPQLFPKVAIPVHERCIQLLSVFWGKAFAALSSGTSKTAWNAGRP